MAILKWNLITDSISDIRYFFKLYIARVKHFHPDVRKFVLGQFLVGLGATTWGLFFNLFLNANNFDKSFIGSTLAIGNLATAAFAFPAGFLVGRVAHRHLLFWSQAINIVCLIIAMFSNKPSMLWFFVFLASGFATAARVVAGPLIMSLGSKSERTYIFSLNFLVGYAGGILGNILAALTRRGIATYSLNEVTGYKIAILFGLVLSLTGLIPFLKISHDSKEKKEATRNLKTDNLKNMRWKIMLLMTIPPTFISIGAGLIVQFMNLYFKDVFNLSDTTIGLLMSLQAATTAFGVLLAPALAERIGKINTIVLTEVLSLPFMILMGLTASPWLASFCFVIRAGLMNMSGPVSSTLVMEICLPEEQGLQNALQTFTWALSWAFSAWVYGHLLGGNYSFSFFLAAILYMIAALSYLLIFRKLPEAFSKEIVQK